MATESLPPPVSGWARIWADLTRAGWHEDIVRYAAHLMWVLFLAGAIWVKGWDLSGLNAWLTRATEVEQPTVLDARLSEVALTASGDALPLPETDLTAKTAADPATITRELDNNIFLMQQGRTEVMTYTVQAGDTLFGIAETFALQPETVLWSNYATLRDNPHLLLPNQVLYILPVDGVYHQVVEGNTLESIATQYKVEADVIVGWSGNNLDVQRPVLSLSSYLVIPGGRRELQAWEVPTIKREQKATAASNFGQCPGGYSGIVGTGAFVWPADNHFLSGYDYTDLHHGLDIKAPQGVPIYASDNGVVVYAGWNDFGYGNLVVLDHGNGWQSVYAHLSQWNVTCGQSVAQGNVLGLSGNTGKSSGAHLHFELRYNSAYVNPWTVLGP